MTPPELKRRQHARPDAPQTPVAAVTAWWSALHDQDLAALARVLADDHVSVGGPDGRTVGRSAALQQAQAFLAAGSIDAWSVHDLVERPLGSSAVCSYRWAESGRHAGTPFRLAGLATDVLTRADGGWVIVAHHASVVEPDLSLSEQP